MVEIDLDAREREALRSIIENELSDLSMEIANTDRQDYREMLSRRKAVLQKVIDALEVADGR